MNIKNKYLKLFLKYSVLFSYGGFLYMIIELSSRHRTHYTMGFLGGLCFISLGCINEFFKWETPLWKQSLIGSAIITILEFISGCILNLLLGWNVWDYSNMPFNILGQICPQFFILWIFVAAAGIILDDYLRYWLFNEDKPRYILF